MQIIWVVFCKAFCFDTETCISFLYIFVKHSCCIIWNVCPLFLSFILRPALRSSMLSFKQYTVPLTNYLLYLSPVLFCMKSVLASVIFISVLEHERAQQLPMWSDFRKSFSLNILIYSHESSKNMKVFFFQRSHKLLISCTWDKTVVEHKNHKHILTHSLIQLSASICFHSNPTVQNQIVFLFTYQIFIIFVYFCFVLFFLLMNMNKKRFFFLRFYFLIFFFS